MTAPTSLTNISQADLSRAKARARKKARKIRQGLPPESGEEAASRLTTNFMDTISLNPGAVIAGYWPIREEISPLALMRSLEERGHSCALARLENMDADLEFRLWTTGDPLEDGPFEIPQPLATAAIAAPDCLLVPLLAFDQTGGRLGYGRGYYDRALARLRAKKTIQAIGLGFAAQQAESLPASDDDARLDYVITEKNVAVAPDSRIK